MIHILILTLFFSCFGVSVVNAAPQCHLLYPDNYKDNLKKFTYKYTTDGLNEYLRYTDKTGSRFLNLGVPVDQEYEFHIITVDSKNPTLKIKPSKKPLVIFIASNNAEKWLFQLEDGAFIKRVYVAYSKKMPEIHGIPENTEITKRIYKRKKNKSFCSIPSKWEGYPEKIKLHNEEWRTFKWSVGQHVGLIETSYNNHKRPKKEIVIPFDPSLYKRNDIKVNNKFFNMTDIEAIQFYKDKFQNLDSQTKQDMQIIINLMERRKLPLLYPNNKSLRYFTPLQLNTKKITYSPQADSINIKSGDYIIKAGFGDDIIFDKKGSYPNISNRSIYFFNKGWGYDKFETRCQGRRISNIIPSNGKDFWQQKGFEYTNFYVFGPGIYPENMKWYNPFKLENIKTGDTIEFSGKSPSWCGHFIFYEQGEMERFNWLTFYDKL